MSLVSFGFGTCCLGVSLVGSQERSGVCLISGAGSVVFARAGRLQHAVCRTRLRTPSATERYTSISPATALAALVLRVCCKRRCGEQQTDTTAQGMAAAQNNHSMKDTWIQL